MVEKSDGDNKGGGVMEEEAGLGAVYKGAEGKVVSRRRGGVDAVM